MWYPLVLLGEVANSFSNQPHCPASEPETLKTFIRQKELEISSNLAFLAQVAILESDQPRSTASEPETAITGSFEEEKQNRASLRVPFVFIPTRKRTYVIRRPSMIEKLQIPRLLSSPYISSSSSLSIAGCKRRMKSPLGVSEEEEKQRIRSKKRKNDDSGASSSCSATARETPLWLVNVMRVMNGDNPKLIIEKKLFKTDVSRNHGRLSIPSNCIVEKDFLTATEEAMIDAKCRFKTSNEDLKAILVDPCTSKWDVVLRRWDMKKDSGNFTSIYVLLSTWNDIVDANGFKNGDKIELWSFRSPDGLCFALVPTTRSTSSDSV